MKIANCVAVSGEVESGVPTCRDTLACSMIELGRRGAPSLPASRLRELPLQGVEGHGAMGGPRALPSAEVGLGLWPDRDFLVSLLSSSIPAFLIKLPFTAKRLARSGPRVKTVSQ